MLQTLILDNLDMVLLYSFFKETQNSKFTSYLTILESRVVLQRLLYSNHCVKTKDKTMDKNILPTWKPWGEP